MIRPDELPETYHEAWQTDAMHAHSFRVFMRRFYFCAAFCVGALAWWIIA